MSNELIVFDKIDNPLAFVEAFGDSMADSGMFGTTKKSAGRVLAMACLCERKNPIEISRTYHIIEGRLSMRADAMHAAFRKAGGRIKWLKDGGDGIMAEAVFTFEGEETTLSYAMTEAAKAGRVKKDSNYDKDPGSMLRARLLSRGIRMLCPEIIAGYYTPEEIDTEERGNEPKQTIEQVNNRREELKRMQEESVGAESAVIEAEFTDKAVEDESPPSESPAPEDQEEVQEGQAEEQAEEKPAAETQPEQPKGHGKIETDQRQQIAAICHQLGSSKEAFAESYKQKHGIEWTEMSKEDADAVISNLEKVANAKYQESQK